MDLPPRRVHLDNAGRYGGFSSRTLRGWLERLVEAEAPAGGALAVRLTSDREVAVLNRRFRDRDGPTDVLSFPGRATPEGDHLGDVVIAVPTAKRQARERDRPLQRELQVLLLHGLLHCLGYDHETDQGEMGRRERRLRARWIDDE